MPVPEHERLRGLTRLNPCPFCGALPGQLCTSSATGRLVMEVHTDRRPMHFRKRLERGESFLDPADWSES